MAFCSGCGEKIIISTWKGGAFETFATVLAASLIVTFTLGIATPWAICYVMKFIIGHVVIDNKEFVFDGKGSQLFCKWFKWILLTIITFGIYGFWVVPKLYRWIA